MIRSMTGFGAADGEIGGWRVAVEARSVNHRFFNPSIKLPSALNKFEGEVREAVRRHVARGHVTVSARLATDSEAEPRIDQARVAAYLNQILAIRDKLGIQGEIQIDAVLRLPGVIVSEDAFTPPDDPAPFLDIVERALRALDDMRAAEGRRLESFLDERLSVADAAMTRIAERAPQRLVEQRNRLRESVKELVEGLAVDEQRLAQEIAILADRIDLSEEVHRFHTHIAAVRAALASPPADGVGKRIGFLLQELLREANTTGSKANDAAILSDVIVIKEELERIREQVENLE